MRKLRPNSRGIIVPTRNHINIGAGGVTHYRKPCQALPRIDRIRGGATPEVCVVRKQGGIGDVLMTLPTVRAIAKRYGIKVDYGTDFEYLEGALPKVLKGNPYINKVIPWRDATGEHYDAVVDLTCPCVTHEKPGAPPINRIDLFARHAGVKLHEFGIDYQIMPEEEAWAEAYLQQNNLDRFKLLLIQSSSSSTVRDAPSDKLQRAVAAAMQHDRSLRPVVISHSSDNFKPHKWNFADVHHFVDFDVRHIAAIMQHSTLVICPDSAVLHVAAALQTPTLTIFGPTDPRARVNYHPEAVAIWPGKELNNYPCWYEDPGDGYMCWKRLEEPLITECILAMITERPLPESRDIVTFGEYTTTNKHYEVV